MKPINDIPLPCPFCGDMPYIDSDPDSCGITIECLSKGCVNPSLYMDHDHQDVTEIAVAHWNQRPPAEPAATAAPVAAPRQEEIDRLTAERDEARAALVKATSEPQTISWQTMRSMREESQATAERLRAALNNLVRHIGEGFGVDEPDAALVYARDQAYLLAEAALEAASDSGASTTTPEGKAFRGEPSFRAFAERVGEDTVAGMRSHLALLRELEAARETIARYEAAEPDVQAVGEALSSAQAALGEMRARPVTVTEAQALGFLLSWATGCPCDYDADQIRGAQRCMQRAFDRPYRAEDYDESERCAALAASVDEGPRPAAAAPPAPEGNAK
jgi:hypothetical protein